MDWAASFDPRIVCFPNKAEIQYAKQFPVTPHGHYKTLRTLAEVRIWKSGTGPEPRENRMVLVRRGKLSPPHSGYFKDAVVLTIPATTITIKYNGTLAFVQAFNRTVAVPAQGSLSIYEDALRQHVKVGELGKRERLSGTPCAEQPDRLERLMLTYDNVSNWCCEVNSISSPDRT